MSSLVRITEMWRLPDTDGTGAEYHVVIHGDDDEVTPCRIAGHFPWLPPTPAPTGIATPLRDYLGRPVTVEDPEMACAKGSSLQRPWRKVTRLVTDMQKKRADAATGHLYVYELECGHQAVRRLKCEKTTCGSCPKVQR